MADGFTFKGVHSSVVGLLMQNPGRIVKPGLRTKEYIVPGRDGTIDLDDEVFEKTSITISANLRASDSPNMRAQQRALAFFLKGSGQLIFDDEPNLSYEEAKVVSSTTLADLFYVGVTDIIFEAQPFAEDIAFNQVQDLNESLPYATTINSGGTQKTPCRIDITAKTTITNLRIERQIDV